jgi:hypothetical protein
MKCVPSLSLALLLTVGLAVPLGAQATAIPYREGSVWNLTFVRVKPGMDDDYLNNLRVNWKRINDVARRQGLVRSYKVISATAANRDDWDLLLMVEYKNMAALDSLREKFEPIQEQIVGQQSEQRSRAIQRNQIREIIGGKLGRELILRDSVTGVRSRAP